MKTRLAILVGAGALGTTLVAAQSVQGPQATFRASADFVTVDVSVRRQNRPVMGLHAADFEVLDNGVPQEVADLSFGKLPIDVTVALDVSDSVTGDVLDQLRQAVQQLTKDLRAEDRLKLMTFNMRVTRVMDFGHGPNATNAAFDQVKAFGSTAVLDTLAVALISASPPDRRQLIMVFSDGHDSASVTDMSVLLDVARHTTPTLGFILAIGTQTMPGAAALRQEYDRLARETGGVVVPMVPFGGARASFVPAGAAAHDVNLASTFQRLLEDFRSSYVLLFTPRGVERSGFHTLGVRVKGADADVHARQGYAWR